MAALVSGATMVGVAAMGVTIHVSNRFADFSVRRLGAHGTSAVIRLSAFVLFCVGIQIIWNGVSVLIGKA